MSLTNIASELAIRNLVGQFALSTLKPTIDFAGLWAPNAQWTLTKPFQNEANGINEILALAGKLGEGWEFFVQFVHSGVVNVNGKNANGTWILQEVARGDRNYNNYAIYEDEYVQVSGKWLFKERHYKYVFLDESPIPGEAFPLDP